MVSYDCIAFAYYWTSVEIKVYKRCEIFLNCLRYKNAYMKQGKLHSVFFKSLLLWEIIHLHDVFDSVGRRRKKRNSFLFIFCMSSALFFRFSNSKSSVIYLLFSVLNFTTCVIATTSSPVLARLSSAQPPDKKKIFFNSSDRRHRVSRNRDMRTFS